MTRKLLIAIGMIGIVGVAVWVLVSHSWLAVVGLTPAISLNIVNHDPTMTLSLASAKKFAECTDLLTPVLAPNHVHSITIDVVPIEPTGADEDAWGEPDGSSMVFAANRVILQNTHLTITLFVNQEVVDTAGWSEQAIAGQYEYEFYSAMATLHDPQVRKSQYGEISTLTAKNMQSIIDTIVPSPLFTLKNTQKI